MNKYSNNQKLISENFETSQSFQHFLKNLEARECVVTFESFEFSKLYHEKLQIIFANIRV
jgi:hypothetical protein